MWKKKLTATDAQQPTNGRIVPYLRFIKGSNPQNNQTWFRNTLFAKETWINGRHGNHVVQECNPVFEVYLNGAFRGSRPLRVTHDNTRMLNNSTPNTWIHYDAKLLSDFSKANLQGKMVTLDTVGGKFELRFG